MPKPPTPTCPTCNYDLTGLINQGSSATCPECNKESTYEIATTIHSRWQSIRITAILLLGIPLPITGISYLLYLNKNYEDGVFGFLIVMALFWHISITTIVLFIKECKFRGRMVYLHTNPAGWISFLSIILPAALSMWLSQSVLMLWAAWIASA